VGRRGWQCDDVRVARKGIVEGREDGMDANALSSYLNLLEMRN
jgi:hypothetical protein